jgi:hypothetical protein
MLGIDRVAVPVAAAGIRGGDGEVLPRKGEMARAVVAEEGDAGRVGGQIDVVVAFPPATARSA